MPRWTRTSVPWLAGWVIAGCERPEWRQGPPPLSGPVGCDVPGTVCTWLGVPGGEGPPEDGADALASPLSLPADVVFSPDGVPFVVAYNNHRILTIEAGAVRTVSGTGFVGEGEPTATGGTTECWAGCDALQCAWTHPTDVAVDPRDPDQLYVAAWHNGRVNRIDTSAGRVYWFAGDGGRSYAAPIAEDADADGWADGDADHDGSVLDQVTFDLPSSVAFDADGTLYVADQANHLVRRITGDGRVEDLAGLPRRPGYAGDGGPAVTALLHGSDGSVAPPSSKLVVHEEVLYFVDTDNGVVRAIDLDTLVISWVAGRHESLGEEVRSDPVSGEEFLADVGSVPGYADGPAGEAVFNQPRDLAVGPDGEIYVADTGNHCVRVVVDGLVSTFAGRCGVRGFAGDGGPAEDALFAVPYGVAVDPEGNVYVADTGNDVIRRIAR